MPVDPNPPLTPGRMIVFAVTAGFMVANLYYAQPLLAEIAGSFGRRTTDAGFLLTLTQLGYALGVLVIVPLGDIMDRRRLASLLLAACAAGLLGAAFSPTFAILAAASLMVGVAASAAMVVIPYVAAHAGETDRGRRVGQVMTGLLLGILLARTVSGFVTAWTNWRVVYVIAAGAVGSLVLALRGAMRTDTTCERLHYGRLMQSLVGLLRAEPELSRRALYALLGLGSFSALWTGLTFLLTAPPYGYSTETVGLFGLIGASGALSANLAGRLGDRGLAQPMTGIFAGLLVLSWAILAEAPASLARLVPGIFLVDVAAQGLQVTHQSVLYRLLPQARSRMTAIFITAGFIGMSLGSALASSGYAAHGWPGVCLVGAAFPGLMFLHWSGRAIAGRRAVAVQASRPCAHPTGGGLSGFRLGKLLRSPLRALSCHSGRQKPLAPARQQAPLINEDPPGHR